MGNRHAATSPSSAKRGRRKRAPLKAAGIVGRKQVQAVQDYLAKLRTLYPHPNRELFYDDVVVAYLLAFFNPAVRSLRCMEDLSRLAGVNRFLSVEAICRSTLSEANALFDPKHLQGLIAHLRSRLPQLKQQDPRLEQLLRQVISFDGSFFRLAGDVQWAMCHRNQGADTRRHVRLNCAFCQAAGTAMGVSLSGDDGHSEAAALAAMINSPVEQGGLGDDGAQRIYLFDSGVVSFEMLETILGHSAHVLCNLRDQVNFTVEKEQAPSDEDRAAGVLSDRIGRLGGSQGRRPPDAILREVVVAYTDRHGNPRHLRLLTDLLDLPARVIAALYRYRWQVELFFRWLKVHAQFRHLMSFSPNGVTTGFYIATIAAMLMCLHTNQPPSKYAVSLFGAVAAGLASPAEILPILQRRERERDLERKRLARKRAEKNKG
jgi:Transposase DDE domain